MIDLKCKRCAGQYRRTEPHANEFERLQDDTVAQVILYSNHLIKEGIKSVSWTLTNDFKVTIRDLKRKARN